MGIGVDRAEIGDMGFTVKWWCESNSRLFRSLHISPQGTGLGNLEEPTSSVVKIIIKNQKIMI